jgi:hypothetical protein
MHKISIPSIVILIIVFLTITGCGSPTTQTNFQPTSTLSATGFVIDGTIDNWPSDSLKVSDLYGDISTNVNNPEGLDLKAIYAFRDKEYFYAAIQIYGEFSPTLLRNYFCCLDFNKDMKDEYQFGLRPDADNWVFDHTIDPTNENAEKTSDVTVASSKDTIEIKIPIAKYAIPSNIYVWCFVTEGAEPIDTVKWFEVNQKGTSSVLSSTSTSTIPENNNSTYTAPKNDIELKYDDGSAESSCSAGGYGFRVHYSPPSVPFIIKRIMLFTNAQGSGYDNQQIEIMILDKDLASLFSCQKPATEFTISPGWVTLDIPNVIVDDYFYVYLYTNSKKEGGVYLYLDNSTINLHSEYIAPTGEVAPWTWPFPKETANWMIRVSGEPDNQKTQALTETQTAVMSPTTEVLISPEFQDIINALDTPQGLSQWMISNIQMVSRYEQFLETGIVVIALPEETFNSRVGNCLDTAIFACYILECHGYTAEIFSIKVSSDQSRNHAVCLYHLDGDLYIIDDRVIKGPYTDFESIASAYYDAWSSYEIRDSWETAYENEPPDEVFIRN